MLLVASVDRDGGLVRDRTHDAALRVEQLDDGVGLGERRLPALVRRAGTSPPGAGPVVAEARAMPRIVRALQQEPVGLGRSSCSVLTCAAYTHPTTTTANVVATTSSSRRRRLMPLRSV